MAVSIGKTLNVDCVLHSKQGMDIRTDRLIYQITLIRYFIKSIPLNYILNLCNQLGLPK